MPDVSDQLLDRLEAWGVRRIYGYPGDGINGFFGALRREGDRFEFVQARHEETAAFMACAHAKYTGELGVVVCTSGPGAIHILNGLYDAKLNHEPGLALGGQQARAALGSSYLQEVDLPALFKDVAHEYVQMATSPEQVRHLLDRAVRTALAERTPTALILPTDVQELEAVPEPPHEHYMAHSAVGWSKPRVVPEDADLRRAADALNAGEKVAILVGQGALGAGDEVTQVADVLGAGVAKALLGKPVLPDDLPFVTGPIGLLGSKPSWDMMMGCDTLLMVGSGFPYAEFLPEEGQARGVQIDIDGRQLGLRYPMEVNLTGDSRETLRALLPLLEEKQDRSWRERIEKGVAEWWPVLEARAMSAANPVNPQRVVWELSPRVPDRAIITSDSGSCANWYARDLKTRRGMMCSLSGGLASMGAAVPYAIAAKFAHPDRPVVSLVGDGAMQMNNMAELITVAKYWRRWSNPTWVCCVWNNEDLNQVTWEQRVQEGDPKFMASQELPNVAYHKFAQMIGLRGIYVDDPERVGPAWDEALASGVPTVIEVKTDPNVPPLPPHITLEQAKKLTTTLLRGDPEEASVIKGAAREVLSSILPGRGS